jgi:hypothetical protein
VSGLTKAHPNGRIKVAIGYTKNMKNFESLRLDVGLEFDGDVDSEEAWEQAWNMVDAQLEKKLLEVDGVS